MTFFFFLSDNVIGSEGVGMLCEVLNINTTLKELDIEGK